MTIHDTKITYLYETADAVLYAVEFSHERDKLTLAVSDRAISHYRISFYPARGRISLGIDAEWTDDRPGYLANFTPIYEYTSSDYAPDEITITDEGLLCAMARESAASHVDIRRGFTVKLPPGFVQPIRYAVEILRHVGVDNVSAAA